jgi:hypothetical protein
VSPATASSAFRRRLWACAWVCITSPP